MKVLVLRFSSIGDIVLTSPVLRCLKEQVPGVELHYLTKSAFVDLLRANPHLHKVHHFNQDVGEVAPTLRAEGFDLIVDLHKNIRSKRVRRKLGVESRAFYKLNVAKWKLVNLKWNTMPDIHIVDRYLQTVAHLGVKNDGKGIEHFIPKDEEIATSTLPEEYQNGYVALAIGAAHATKRLPEHKLKQICDQLGQPIVLLGGPAEAEVAGRISESTTGTVHNLVGKLSLNGSASLVKNADLVICHDSGMMHLAAAFQKHTISIWGNTVPEFGMYAYMPQHPERNTVIQVDGLPCRPCSKIGFEKCPKRHFKCMEQVETKTVLAAASAVAE